MSSYWHTEDLDTDHGGDKNMYFSEYLLTLFNKRSWSGSEIQMSRRLLQLLLRIPLKKH